eukprot:scaffold190730_cov24-Tisochrysis_lutea.AAC.1
MSYPTHDQPAAYHTNNTLQPISYQKLYNQLGASITSHPCLMKNCKYGWSVTSLKRLQKWRKHDNGQIAVKTFAQAPQAPPLWDLQGSPIGKRRKCLVPYVQTSASPTIKLRI